MLRNVIRTENAPAAIGPYSQGIAVKPGLLIFTAGQLPVDVGTGQIVEGGIEEQTKKSLENVKAVVEAGGGRMEDVVKTTVFLKDMNDFAKMNDVYKTFFQNDPPARSAIEAARLPKDVLVEIECVALVRNI
jgi:2-iminobutanoate/2-iminopropanoate deaminase